MTTAPAKRCVWAVDLGAGSGAKLGLVDVLPGHRIASEVHTALLPREQYGSTGEELATRISVLLKKLAQNMPGAEPLALGIASPGLFRSDGSYFLVSNLGFLRDQNLPALLRHKLGVPVFIENDANAGGLAEWDLARHALFYWVFGGGWGGAWISAQGGVRFPAVDWDGKDTSLHLTNEPGYATPILHADCRAVFDAEGIQYDLFLDRLIEADYMKGPDGRTDCFRAEGLLSGPGRWRLFRAVLDSLQIELKSLGEPYATAFEKHITAGPYLQQFCEEGHQAAYITEHIFGRVLGIGAKAIWLNAHRDGAQGGLPVYLAGGPARLYDYFVPHAIEEMRKREVPLRLMRSQIEARDENPNLRGAAVLAANRIRSA